MVAWIKTQWSQLPHQMQAFITAFGSGVFTTIMGHMASGNSCLTLKCVEARIPEVLSAGAAAALAFYMKPNKPADPKP